MAVIKTPVTEPSDIQSVLNISTTNYGTIMRPDLFNMDVINEMSKKKPLDRNILHSLTDEQFKSGVGGASGTNGIYWGLKIATSAKNWTTIHSANWEYVEKPKGGIDSSPFRPSDFVGYDSSAKPTLTVETDLTQSGAEVIFSAITPFTCLLKLNISGNTTGVDPLDALGITSSNAYLCVAIGNYAAAMLNGRANDTVAPISSNGGKTQIEYTCPELPSGLKSAATRQVTFFIANINDISTLKNGGWLSFSNTAQAVKAASLPNVAGLSVKFSQISSLGFGDWEFASPTTSGTSFTIAASCKTTPTYVSNPTIYGYEVSATFNNSNGTKKTFTRTLTSSSVNTSLMNAVLTWASSEFGFVPSSNSSIKYTLNLYGVSYTAGGSTLERRQLLTTTTGTFTYTGTSSN